MSKTKQKITPETIPWLEPEVWHQVKEFFHVSAPNEDSRTKISSLASAITQRILAVDRDLEMLCRKTCPGCRDNCCLRATVWYDFRDLVFTYCAKKKLPQAQIRRRVDNSCCHLTESGCSLPRVERPFICTWYLCGVQQQLIASHSAVDSAGSILEALREVQRLRKELEEEYIRSLTCLE